MKITKALNFALGEGAGDQRRRDDGEHHLEDHEGLVRDASAA